MRKNTLPGQGPLHHFWLRQKKYALVQVKRNLLSPGHFAKACLESTVSENTNTSQLKCDFPNSWSITKNLQDARSTFFESASHSGGARLRTSRNCANWPPVRVKNTFSKKASKTQRKMNFFGGACFTIFGASKKTELPCR